MPEPKLKLSLFVSSYNAGRTLSRLYKALEYYSYTDYELSIVDVIKEPIRAQSYEVRETPTLIRHTEEGDIVLTDDLSNIFHVRNYFGFKTED